MELRKGIAYCRVSTDGQECNTSLEDQEERILAFAKSQGIEIVQVFKDTATGTNTRRKGYQDALNFMAENEIQCFVVAKFDRVHRNQLNLLSFQKELQDKDISFISVKELLDTSTATGQLMFEILGSFAQFECNSIKDRTTSGRKKKLKENKNAGGAVPIGYEKGYEINDVEAEIVKDLFWTYKEKRSLAKVKKVADSKGYRGRKGKQLSCQAIHHILTNRCYMGHYIYDGKKEKNAKVIVGHHKHIVSRVLFGKVQKILKSNSKRW